MSDDTAGRAGENWQAIHDLDHQRSPNCPYCREQVAEARRAAEARVDTDAVDVLLDALERVAQMRTCPACHATGVTQAHRRDCFVLDAINRAKAALTPPASEPRNVLDLLERMADAVDDYRPCLICEGPGEGEHDDTCLVTEAREAYLLAGLVPAHGSSDAAEREGE